MTIEEFLDENTYNLTPAEYNAALEDLEMMDKKSWIEKYAPLMESKTAGWLDVEDVKKAKYLPSRIREAFGSSDDKNVFDRPSNYINEVYYKDFEDVPREQFDAALGKMRQYAQEDIDARHAEAGRKRREQEVKNWNSSKRGLLRSLLASDYEKQRYIDNPSAAIFGEEATPISRDWLGKGEAIQDLALGGMGAVGDLVPGVGGAVIGPGIRAVRDVSHKVYDSPYQKDWGDIATSVGTDVFASAGAEFLPNFRQYRRMLAGAADNSTLGKRAAISRETEAINKGFKEVVGDRWDAGRKMLSSEEAAQNLVKDGGLNSLRTRVGKMPESELKRALDPLVNKSVVTEKDLKEIRDILVQQKNIAQMAETEEGREMFKNLFGSGEDVSNVTKGALKSYNNFTPYTRAILDVTEMPKLSKFQERVTLPVMMATKEGLAGVAGAAAIKAGATAKGRSNAAKRVETPEERAQIEEIKKREESFWKKDGKPWFKPNKDNSLLYKAWEEYAKEQGWEVK